MYFQQWRRMEVETQIRHAARGPDAMNAQEFACKPHGKYTHPWLIIFLSLGKCLQCACQCNHVCPICYLNRRQVDISHVWSYHEQESYETWSPNSTHYVGSNAADEAITTVTMKTHQHDEMLTATWEDPPPVPSEEQHPDKESKN